MMRVAGLLVAWYRWSSDPYRSALADGAMLSQFVANPLSLPVALIEQAGLPPTCIAPRIGRPVLVPYRDAPVVATRGLQRRAGVVHGNRAVGFDLAAVPDVRFA